MLTKRRNKSKKTESLESLDRTITNFEDTISKLKQHYARRRLDPKTDAKTVTKEKRHTLDEKAAQDSSPEEVEVLSSDDEKYRELQKRKSKDTKRIQSIPRLYGQLQEDYKKIINKLPDFRSQSIQDHYVKFLIYLFVEVIHKKNDQSVAEIYCDLILNCKNNRNKDDLKRFLYEALKNPAYRSSSLYIVKVLEAIDGTPNPICTQCPMALFSKKSQLVTLDKDIHTDTEKEDIDLAATTATDTNSSLPGTPIKEQPRPRTMSMPVNSTSSRLQFIGSTSQEMLNKRIQHNKEKDEKAKTNKKGYSS